MRRAGTLCGLIAAAIIALAGASAILPAFALQPDEILADPATEKRARALSAGLRCLVCQNQSIDESDAPLARDLRLLVRERLKAGESDAAVTEFVVSRYGDFVLLKPPFKASTWLLWFGPFLALGAGAVALWIKGRGRGEAQSAPSEALSPQEQAEVQALLEQK